MAKRLSRAAAPVAGPQNLAGLLDRRVEELRAHLRRALRSWEVDAIHQARVTTRRLKAAVDLLRPLLPDEPVRDFSRALRKFRRTLGPLRDVDVMLQHLEDMKVPAALRPGAEWASARLRERRAELRRESARNLTARKALSRLESWVDLEQEVRDAESAAGPLLARVAPSQVGAFAERADRISGLRAGDHPSGAASVPASGAAADDPSSDDVHSLRVAGKLLRYTLELAEPLGRDVPRSVAKEFKALQEALGLWHDYVVLTGEMLRMAVDAELPARHPERFGQVQELARVCWKRSARHLDQFRKLWKERGAALADRVGGAFATPAPHTAAAPDDANGKHGDPDHEPSDGSNGSNDETNDEVSHSRPTHHFPG